MLGNTPKSPLRSPHSVPDKLSKGSGWCSDYGCMSTIRPEKGKEETKRQTTTTKTQTRPTCVPVPPGQLLGTRSTVSLSHSIATATCCNKKERQAMHKLGEGAVRNRWLLDCSRFSSPSMRKEKLSPHGHRQTLEVMLTMGCHWLVSGGRSK